MKMFDNGAEGCGAVTCAFWALGQAVYRVGTLGFADVHDPVRDAYYEGRISRKQYVAGAAVSLAVPIINGATVVSTGGTGTSAAAAASTTLVNRVINASITGGAVALANDSVTQAAHVSSGIQSEYSVKQAALTTGAGLLVGGVVGAGAELVPVIASKLKDVAGSLVDAARSAQAARQIAKAIDAGEVPAMPGAAARQISADASTQSVPASSIRSQITQEGNGLGVSAAGVRGQGVAAEIPPVSQNRGLTFVSENLGKPRNAAMQAARDFESGTTGAFSDIATRQRQVPALRFDNPKSQGAPYVKFDGHQQLDSGIVELIDSKTRIVPFARTDGPFISASVRDGLVRKSQALAQNPGYAGVIELPTAAARKEAQQVLRQIGITNISTRVRVP